MRFALYFHGGSYNHGCEALVLTTSALIKKEFPSSVISLLSFAAKEDAEADISTIDEIVEFKFSSAVNSNYTIKKNPFEYIKLFLLSKYSTQKADEYFYSLPYKKDKSKKEIIKKNDIFISIGGDNYCYGEDITALAALNHTFKKAGKPTVLWGCSIGAKDLTKQKIEDISSYDLITVRESMTFDLLCKLGLNNKLYLHADPAFSMEPEFMPLPNKFIENRTVGINIGPLIASYEPEGYKGIGLKSVQNLIEYLLSNTDYAIALIPHVVKPHSNDLDVLNELYNSYVKSGRVCIIGNDKCPNAKQLKGYIARCSYFVGARTHATIAAYSSLVPTLVLGYSVKSIGIARDIFGNEEGLVLPINDLKDEDMLTTAFVDLLSKGDYYRTILQEKMPNYIQSAKDAILRIKAYDFNKKL